MITKNHIYIIPFLLSLLCFVNVTAQVKIGENHTTINAGSLLELESSNKGLMFPRVALDNDLKEWKLNGGVEMDGMVVFNTNDAFNPEGLYCWYNDQWNHFASGGNVEELDTLSFNVDSRVLNDDGDTAEIPSGRVSIIDNSDLLLQYLLTDYATTGDIYYVNGDGVYIRNNVTNAATIAEGYIFISAMAKPGRILYANYSSVVGVHDSINFKLGVLDSFYHEPDNPNIINVDTPSNSGNNGYYAFAVPSEWANPRIFLKVKNSADGGFFKLDNCWNVTREMQYDGILYQVWTLDIPMRESVMAIINSKAQFLIE
ncbi:MAG: hypothetical protein PF444_09715 [Bacteroidales bacterium]|jgi:hypothetical protein|nr:hypothetical protein [Bacteroidales bacterium]